MNNHGNIALCGAISSYQKLCTQKRPNGYFLYLITNLELFSNYHVRELRCKDLTLHSFTIDMKKDGNSSRSISPKGH